MKAQADDQRPKCILVLSGTMSGVGKTTVTVGLMTAFAQRGYIVQPFKTGPDFLDGMHHEAGIRAGEAEFRRRSRRQQPQKDAHEHHERTHRRCINLDGWMMRTPSAVLASFHHHSKGADVCIIEGAMGLHDSRDGTSDAGSAAQIAKWLNAPVVLVVDGSMMARSVAAMVLGYTLFGNSADDAEGEQMRMGAVVVNRVGGEVHVDWIRDAVEYEGGREGGLLKDAGTGKAVIFAGALPQDKSIAVPERHMGLTMPKEKGVDANMNQNNEYGKEDDFENGRFLRLATLVEEKLDLDALIQLGQTCQLKEVSSPLSIQNGTKSQTLASILPMAMRLHNSQTPKPCCRIGIAEDEAFCFYYRDNLHLLRMAGAELVPFSPIITPHLPPALDALYIGGGYPELHAQKLQDNESLRSDIRSFCRAGGAVFAECGGLMYLSETLLVSKEETYSMCGIFPFSTRMTPHCKMYYASIKFSSENPLFPPGGQCRGQLFHFSEIVEEEASRVRTTREDANGIGTDISHSPFLVTPQLPGATSEPTGIVVNNAFASYLHLHFASFVDKAINVGAENSKTLADHLVQNAITTSPYRNAYAVSFVSAATEIIFALGQGSTLAGVTSICDFPVEARSAPRRVVCRPSIDAASMTSEEVELAMNELRKMKMGAGEGPPRHWIVDGDALKEINPRVVFVQNVCEICDTSLDDVLYALQEHGLGKATVVHVAPTTLRGLFDSINDIAEALDIVDRGNDLIRTLKDRLGRIQEEVSELEAPRPKILSLEGLAPLCTGGHWLPDLKFEAGCADALGHIGGCPAKILSWDEIIDADPDILVISPCSGTITRTLNEMHLLASSPKFWKLRCVQKGDVYIIDHCLFSRPGPRLVEGVELLATLFRKILTPSSPCLDAWGKIVLKYDCSTNFGVKSIPHCTTELAFRFSPCLGSQGSDEKGSIGEESPHAIIQRKTLQFCSVTRCTIPGFPSPDNRSAHCIIPVHRNGQKKMTLLLIGGENSRSKRLNDTWELHPPSTGWSDSNQTTTPTIGTTPTWEYLICGKVAGENVPTRRSNHAAVVCGNYVLVFGGWGIDNVTPLSHCELLHLESLCWTHCSTRGAIEPSPRGNPSLVYSEGKNCAFLFGGWNGKRALGDLWCLDMSNWQWYDLTLAHGKDEKYHWPSPRTDHSSVIWKQDENYESVLIFGGNVEGRGTCAELWKLTFSSSTWNNAKFNDKKKASYHWDLFKVSGPTPPSRTSHTTAITGVGMNARMVIVGGTSSALGTGRGSMLCDAWILNLGRKDGMIPSWSKLDWSGRGIDRCRHAMALIDARTIVIYGGYDGEVTVDECVGVWQGTLPPNKEQNVHSIPSVETAHITKKHTRLQERWEAEIPVRVEDLPPETLAKAKCSRLPGALYKALHRHAVAHNRDTYIDPDSGYSVFSQVYLKRRPCCGNACRHCPHGHINVPGKSKNCLTSDSKIEW